MSKAKTLLPPWTKSDEDSKESESPETQKYLSGGSCDALTNLELIFRAVNERIYRCMTEEAETPSYQKRKPGFYTDEDRQKMIKLRTLEDVDRHKCWQTVMPPITNIDYLDIWQSTVKYLLMRQGIYSSNETWVICKQTALDFLELRERIRIGFQDIEEELRKFDHHIECENILFKIQVLKRFEVVYNRQPASPGGHPLPPEPIYESEMVRPWNTRVVEAYAHDNTNEKQNPTLIAILIITTAISIIPLILSWRLSKNLPGTTEDVDFYLLIQNSIMQLLGLFMALYPTERRPASSAWHWARIFTATGAGCAIAAIPMYLYLPTMWSALMGFFASIAQAIMTLELVLMANSTVRSTKVKE